MPLDRQLIDPTPKTLGRVLRQAVRSFSPGGDLLARGDVKGVVRVVPWRAILEGA